MTSFTIFYCLFFGCFAGFMGGLIGIGGGFVLVPALLYLFLNTPEFLHNMNGNQIYYTVGTTMAAIFFTSYVAKKKNNKAGFIEKEKVQGLKRPVIVGVVFGALLSMLFNVNLIKMLFGVFCLYASFRMLTNRVTQTKDHVITKNQYQLSGWFYGGICGLLGVGGANLFVPFLVKHGTELRQAVATASYLQIPIAITGTIVYIVLGLIKEPHAPEYTIGYVHWLSLAFIVIGIVVATPFGVTVSHKLPVVILKRVFGLFTGIIGASMIYKFMMVM